MPTLDLSPAVTGDDGVRTSGAFSTSILRSGDVAANDQFAWLRFSGATIPAGASITVAHITLTRTANGAGTVLTNIFGIAEDNHVAPTNEATWVTDHGIHTVAFVAWDFASAATGTHQTPSLVSIIQELVDRPGWVSGNAIGIHIDDDSSVGGVFQTWEDFEAAGTAHAVLHIEYTEASDSAGRLLLLGVG